MDTPSPEGSLKEEAAALRQQLATLRVNLSGQDWLTVNEAAHYCGVFLTGSPWPLPLPRGCTSGAFGLSGQCHIADLI
jgi:hypothetical protein